MRGRGRRLSRGLAKEDEGGESFEQIPDQMTIWKKGVSEKMKQMLEMERQGGERLLMVTEHAAARMDGAE